MNAATKIPEESSGGKDASESPAGKLAPIDELLKKESNVSISSYKVSREQILVLLSIVWAGMLYPLLHMYTYTRRYFEGLTIFDMVMLLLTLPAAFITLNRLRMKPLSSLILGLFGAGLVSILSFFLLSLGDEPAKPAAVELLGFIPTSGGSLLFIFFLYFAMIGISSALKIISWRKIIGSDKYRERMINMQTVPISLLLGLGMYAAITALFPTSLYSCFYSASIMDSLGLILIGLTPGKIPNVYFNDEDLELLGKVERLPTLGGQTRIMRVFAFFLEWLVFTAYLMVNGLLYAQSLSRNSDYKLTHNEKVIFLIMNIAIGLLILLPMVVNEGAEKMLYNLLWLLLPIFTGVYGAWLKDYDQEPFAPLVGLTIGLVLWYYIEKSVTYSKRLRSGIWLSISLVAMGYLSFIPAHWEDIVKLIDYFPYILPAIALLHGIARMLFGHLPTRCEWRDYVKVVLAKVTAGSETGDKPEKDSDDSA